MPTNAKLKSLLSLAFLVGYTDCACCSFMRGWTLLQVRRRYTWQLAIRGRTSLRSYWRQEQVL